MNQSQSHQSLSPIRVVDSFEHTASEKKFFSVWKLMQQVLGLHNSLNEVKATVTDLTKLWRNSHSQMQSSIATILCTFRNLLMTKDNQILSLKQKISNINEQNQKLQKQAFNRCLKGSILKQIEKETQRQKSKSQQSSSSQYLQSLEKQVELIKQKLALLDQQDHIGDKLVTIREVTELATSRQRQQDELMIKQQYEAMINSDTYYDYKDDLDVLKNYNLESTKVIASSNQKDLLQSIQDPQLNQFKQNQNKDNKQNVLNNNCNNNHKQHNIKKNHKISQNKNMITLEFPNSPKVTLISLSQVKPNLLNQTQNYIGNYSYTGAFDENSERNGYGSLKKSSKQIYVGNWKKGQFDGWGKFYLNTSKFIQYSGQFKNGLFNGRGTLIYRNGDKFIGQIIENKAHGQGTLYKQGQTIYGIWDNNSLIKKY